MPGIATGPVLPNAQPPDWYLRVKQNIDSLRRELGKTVETGKQPRRLSDELIKQIRDSLQATGQFPLNVTGLPGLPSFIGANGAVFSQTVTLVSATTLITSTATIPTAGDLLVVTIVQDGTGGRRITWSSDFKFASVDIFTDANSTSIFQFIGRTISGTTKWYCCGYVTGQL